MQNLLRRFVLGSNGQIYGGIVQNFAAFSEYMNFDAVVVLIKFIYSEKAIQFCEIFTLLLTGTTYDKSKLKISKNLVAFSEYIYELYWFFSFI